MPKPPASPEAVEAVRERILAEALFIINQDGYADLSMRRLARRLGFTARTIYNYYSNKDEIYLMALIKGFQALAEEFEAAYMLSLIHISEPTRLLSISYAVFCLKKKKQIK